MGIKSFRDKESSNIAAGIDNKRTQKRLPSELHRSALRKIQILRAAKQLSDIRNFPGLKLERLKGERSNEYSIRINVQFRICFKWDDGNAIEVSIEDYH
jgi:proteic killer suppression protein